MRPLIFSEAPHFLQGPRLQPAQPTRQSGPEWTAAILSNRGIFSTKIIYLQLTIVHQLHILHISIKTWFAYKVVVFFVATSASFVGPPQAFKALNPSVIFWRFRIHLITLTKSTQRLHYFYCGCRSPTGPLYPFYVTFRF